MTNISSSCSASQTAYNDLFFTQLNEVAPSNRLDFVEKFFNDETWVSQNPKLCRKIVKYLLKHSKDLLFSGEGKLDLLVHKMVLLFGESRQKFCCKIFRGAIASHLVQSCSVMLRDGIWSQLTSEDKKKLKPDDMAVIAAETNSIHLLHWLRTNYPALVQLKAAINNFHSAVQPHIESNIEGTTPLLEELLDNPHFDQKYFKELIGLNDRYFCALMPFLAEHERFDLLDRLHSFDARLFAPQWTAAIIHGRVSMLDWLKPRHSFDLETTLKSAAAYSSLASLKWLQKNYPEEVAKLLSPLPAILAKHSSAAVWEWILEQLPNQNVSGLVTELVAQRRSSSSAVGEVRAELIAFFAPKVDEAAIALLAEYAVDVFLEKDEMNQAISAMQALPATMLQKRFELNLQIDMTFLPRHFTTVAISSNAANIAKALNLIEQRLQLLFSAKNAPYLTERISKFVKDQFSSRRVLEAVVITQRLVLLEYVRLHCPHFQALLFDVAAANASIKVLNWFKLRFADDLPELLKAVDSHLIYHGNADLWKWALENIEFDVRAYVAKLISRRTEDMNAAFISLVSPKIDAETLQRLIAHALDTLLAQGKAEEAKEVAILIEDSKRRFEASLKIDLIAIPAYIAEISRSTLAPDDPMSPAYLVEERLKYLFAPENHAYLDKALPQLLANPITVNYLLNSRVEKLSELLSLQGMSEDTKRIFLPLLPPTEMVGLMHALALEEKQALLQIPLATPLIEAEMSTKAAILLALQNWVPKIHGSRDEADTYMPMVAMFYRSLPFPTLAAAASLNELQEGMIRSLKAMHPIQQAVVIPQLDAERLVVYLHGLSLSEQGVLLGMCCADQKIKYLQEFDSEKLTRAEMLDFFKNKKAEIEGKFALIEKEASQNTVETLSDQTSELYTEILSLSGTMKNCVKRSTAILSLLYAKLSDAKELTLELNKLIESKKWKSEMTLDSQIDDDIKQLENAFTALEQKLGILSERDAPEEYLCTISQEVMNDPVIADDNQHYDRKNIQRWLDEGKTTSPYTRKPMGNVLKDDLELKRAIMDWRVMRKASSSFVE